MVKLIVTDMDNTLILPDKTLPKGIFPLISRLYEKGIRFAAASARHYNGLHQMFGAAASIMGFICDNGAYGEIDGCTFAGEALCCEELSRIIDVCSAIPGIHISLSTRTAMYYQGDAPKKPQSHAQSVNALYHRRYVPCLSAVKDDVYRVMVYDPAGVLSHSLPILKRAFGSTMSVTATDVVCVDIMKQGINKGTGLAALQERLHITSEETMAFGDYYNDIEMLDRAYNSYAVENAEAEVKTHCRIRTESNAACGVLSAIEAYLKENNL